LSAALFEAVDVPLVAAIKDNHHHSLPSLVGPNGALCRTITRLQGFVITVQVRMLVPGTMQ
jgi:hypothetical protein